MLRDKRRERAIVIGGSIAGMLAAPILADYFATVTIVETRIGALVLPVS